MAVANKKSTLHKLSTSNIYTRCIHENILSNTTRIQYRSATQNVGKDGNCFFYALSHILQSIQYYNSDFYPKLKFAGATKEGSVQLRQLWANALLADENIGTLCHWIKFNLAYGIPGGNDHEDEDPTIMNIIDKAILESPNDFAFFKQINCRDFKVFIKEGIAMIQYIHDDNVKRSTINYAVFHRVRTNIAQRILQTDVVHGYPPVWADEIAIHLILKSFNNQLGLLIIDVNSRNDCIINVNKCRLQPYIALLAREKQKHYQVLYMRRVSKYEYIRVSELRLLAINLGTSITDNGNNNNGNKMLQKKELVSKLNEQDTEENDIYKYKFTCYYTNHTIPYFWQHNKKKALK